MACSAQRSTPNGGILAALPGDQTRRSCSLGGSEAIWLGQPAVVWPDAAGDILVGAAPALMDLTATLFHQDLEIVGVQVVLLFPYLLSQI